MLVLSYATNSCDANTVFEYIFLYSVMFYITHYIFSFFLNELQFVNILHILINTYYI